MASVHVVASLKTGGEQPDKKYKYNEYNILPEKFEPFNMSAAPLDTKRSPGETSNPGKLTTTELRLLSWSLREQ